MSISWLLPGLGKVPGPPHKATGLGFGHLLGEQPITRCECKGIPRNGSGSRTLPATLTQEEPQHFPLRPPSMDLWTRPPQPHVFPTLCSHRAAWAHTERGSLPGPWDEPFAWHLRRLHEGLEARTPGSAPWFAGCPFCTVVMICVSQGCRGRASTCRQWLGICSLLGHGCSFQKGRATTHMMAWIVVPVFKGLWADLGRMKPTLWVAGRADLRVGDALGTLSLGWTSRSQSCAGKATPSCPGCPLASLVLAFQRFVALVSG